MSVQRPAVRFCLPLVAGIILGWECHVGRAVLLGAGAFLFLCSCFTMSDRRSVLRSVLIMLLIADLGMLKVESDEAGQWRRGDRPGAPESVATLSCRSTDEPRVFAGAVRFSAEVESVLTGGKRRPLTGGLLVSIADTLLPPRFLDSLSYGKTFSATGELRPPGRIRNPGDFDQESWFRTMGIEARFRIASPGDIRPTGTTEGSFLAGAVVPVRRSVSRAIGRLFPEDAGQFLKGLLIGERSDISAGVKTAFINTGVMHILAVSGLHVAIVSLMLLGLFRFVRVGEQAAVVLTMISLCYYAFVTGAAPSVTRSVVMALVLLGARLLQERVCVYNVLAISCIAILLYDARQLFQPGFQLSFAAVFALFTLLPRFKSVSDRLRVRSKAVVILVDSLTVSLAAGIGTLPVTALYFGKISFVGIAANIVVVPLSNVILAIGMVSVAASYISGWLGGVIAGGTTALTQFLLFLVGWCSRLPFAYVGVRWTLSGVVAAYVLGAVLFRLRRPVRSGFLIILSALALWWLLAPFLPHRALRVTMCDVGQGDGILIETPEGKNIVIDAGPRSASWDAGERCVSPVLREAGVGAIDVLIVTHPHSDHLGGIPFLLRTLPVRRVIDAGSSGQSALDREYGHLIDSLKIPRATARSGEELLGSCGIRLYCLFPDSADIVSAEHPGANLNNESVVLRLVYGRSSILLAGDAEQKVEESMRSRYGDFLKSDLIKAGHHGSITSSSEEFVRCVSPGIALISVGAKNKFHHPSPVVIDRYLRFGAACRRTDSLGAVVVESDGSSWHVVDWR